VIATDNDRGRDTGPLPEGRAAIAYDPDGCQNWIIDDGVEGYSTPPPRPGVGPARLQRPFPARVRSSTITSPATQGIRDYVPGTSRRSN
jgi:hypothetical protein